MLTIRDRVLKVAGIISPAVSFDDLTRIADHFDSLDVQEFASCLEDEFGVVIEDRQIGACVVFADAVALVERLTELQAPAKAGAGAAESQDRCSSGQPAAPSPSLRGSNARTAGDAKMPPRSRPSNAVLRVVKE